MRRVPCPDCRALCTDDTSCARLRRERINDTVHRLGPVRPLLALRDMGWLLDSWDECRSYSEHLKQINGELETRLNLLRQRVADADAAGFGAGVNFIATVRDVLTTYELALKQIRSVTTPDSHVHQIAVETLAKHQTTISKGEQRDA